MGQVIDTHKFELGSTEEKELVELLNVKDELTDDEWDRFFEALGDVTTWRPALYSLFKAVRSEHFVVLSKKDPGLLNALGMEFSAYVRSFPHDFNYCDVLADELGILFNLGNVALKAHCLLTLLVMGVSHNRWFVERKFLHLAAPECEQRVIKRFLLDVETESIDLDELISGWERSIKASRSQLHPEIVSILAVTNAN